MGFSLDGFKRFLVGLKDGPPRDNIALISGDNKPSVILVDLVTAKLLTNLDSIDYKEDEQGVTFAAKFDNMVITGSFSYGRTEVRRNGEWVTVKDSSKDKFHIDPGIKIGNKKITLSKAEQHRLWRGMAKAGKMALEMKREKEEYERQRESVDLINTICEQESDNVREAKRIAEQAVLKLQAPKHMSVEERVLGSDTSLAPEPETKKK